MRKQFVSLALATLLMGSVVAGCSSSKNASSSDTTLKDSSKMSAPMSDTMKKDSAMKDTTKKDTVKKPM
jgi:hypothetical protein